jgi:hypothetical protein
MASRTAAELRKQAAHARHLADKMQNREAQAELRMIADAIDTAASELESGESRAAAPSQPELSEIKKQLAKRARKAARPEDHREEGGQG